MSKIIVCNTLYFRMNCIIGFDSVSRFGSRYTYTLYTHLCITSKQCFEYNIRYSHWSMLILNFVIFVGIIVKMPLSASLFIVYGKLCRDTKFAENLFGKTTSYISMVCTYREREYISTKLKQLFYFEQYKLVEFNSY